MGIQLEGHSKGVTSQLFDCVGDGAPPLIKLIGSNISGEMEMRKSRIRFGSGAVFSIAFRVMDGIRNFRLRIEGGRVFETSRMPNCFAASAAT